MSKQDFLQKLQKELAILEKSEIEDIIEEYEQHIDLKMKDGMSEEDAIKDFGDFNELIAGILEAYHVNANYANNKKTVDFEKVKETGKQMTGAAISGLEHGTKKVFGSLKSAVHTPYQQMKKEFANRPKKSKNETIVGKITDFIKRSLTNCGILVRWMWNTMISCFRFVIRSMWFCFCAGCGLFSLFLEVMGIFGLGFCFVVLVKGYPLLGITIGLLGAVIANGVIFFMFLLECRRMIGRRRESGSHFEKGHGQQKEDLERKKKEMENQNEQQFMNFEEMEVVSNA